MNQHYAEYLAELARNGDMSAWHQLKRHGIEIETETDLKPVDVNLFAYQGQSEGRNLNEDKKPKYLTMPTFSGKKKLA